jgi:hypothetical protein
VERQRSLPDARRAGNHYHGCRCIRVLGGRARASAREKPAQPAQLRPAIHEGADIGGQLTGNGLRIVGTPVGSVEVHPAGDITSLDDIAGHLGTANLASYFTRTGGRAVGFRQRAPRLTSGSGEDGPSAPGSPWGWQGRAAAVATSARSRGRRSC